MFKGRKILQCTIIILIVLFAAKEVLGALAWYGLAPSAFRSDHERDYVSDNYSGNNKYLFNINTKNLKSLDFDNYKYSLSKEFNFSSDITNCQEIIINGDCGELKFDDSTDNKFHVKVLVTLKSNKFKAIPHDYITFSSGDSINVREHQLHPSSVKKNLHSTFYISIPARYKNKVTATSDVGNITGKINGNDLSLTSDVGDVDLSNINSQNIFAKTDVGSIKLDLSDCNFNKIKCNADVGSVRVIGVKPENIALDLNVDTGSLKLGNGYESFINRHANNDSDDDDSSKHLQKNIGNGEKSLSITTDTGDVSLSN